MNSYWDVPLPSFVFFFSFIVVFLSSCTFKAKTDQEPLTDRLLLKDWMPRSVHNAGNSNIQKPKFPVIDLHAHDYATTREEVARRVEIMDSAGIEKSVILTGKTGAQFDSVYDLYADFPDRFDIYCGIDYEGYEEDGWSQKAVEELRRCVKIGAKGIGEISDKGDGLTDNFNMHPNDPRMDPIFQEAAKLGIPVNLHVAEPIWMYEPVDSTNDGLTRSATWRVQNQDRIIDHDGIIELLAKTLERHPNTIFVAAHLANTNNDLTKLGALFDTYPNLYADISARFAEFSTVPRTTARFFNKYQDRIVFGTDYGWETFNNNTDYGNNTTTLDMFRMTYRVLETQDEHFYMTDLVGYKWPMYGLNLSDQVLKKIYRDNALKITQQ